MDALLSTLIAALLAEQGDKLQLLAAALARRRPAGAVFAGLVAAAFANSLIAGVGGRLLHATVPFRALTLLVAVALLSAAAGAAFRAKPSGVIAYPRLGTLGGAAFAGFVLGFGGGTQFLTFALAARADSAMLATLGATVGTAVGILPVILLGEAWPRAVPLRAIRSVAAMLFLLAGTVAALTALRLI